MTKPDDPQYKANFLWPHKVGSLEEAGYEFANASTKAYREEWWDVLCERAAERREQSAMNEVKRAEKFLGEVSAEWCRASGQHPAMTTVHEAAAVIREEYDEFWDEVRRKRHDNACLRTELVQVAAMCLRAIIDLEL